jgi:hypothetical protein
MKMNGWPFLEDGASSEAARKIGSTFHPEGLDMDAV